MALLSLSMCLWNSERSRRTTRYGAIHHERAQQGVELAPLFEKGVVALDRVDLAVFGLPASGEDAVGDGAHLLGREEPVAADADGQHIRAHLAVRLGIGAAPLGHVVAVHGAGENQVAV